MINLSAIIITFNEERNIQRCFDSLRGVADEIIVVDSFSTDRTEEICHANNVRFIKHKFEGHIEQKNYALTHASYDHVIALDADEALSEELIKSIVQAKGDWRYDGYYMNRLTNYCGQWIRHGGWYPDRKMRLFVKHKGKWGGHNPHDRLLLTGSEGYIKGDLLHYSFYTIAEHVTQVNKFTDIAAKSAYNKGLRSNVLKIILNPRFKFFRDYILRGGFRDGYYGFVISRISAHATFLKYVKLRELQKQK